MNMEHLWIGTLQMSIYESVGWERLVRASVPLEAIVLETANLFIWVRPPQAIRGGYP